MHFRPRNLLGILVIGAGALAGCASTGGADGERDGAAGQPYATVVVENDGTSTVTIYALRSGGTRMRLGQVTGLGQGEFPLRRHMLRAGSQLQLEIDPVGSSRSYPTHTISVNEGDVLRLVVSSFIR